MKIKFSLFFGALITTPIIAFANINGDASRNFNQYSIQHKKQQDLIEKDLILLSNEGAISKEEADRLIKKLPSKKSEKVIINPQERHKKINESKSEHNQKGRLEIIESNNSVQLNILNIDQIINSEIIKSKSGWQLILQLPNVIEIDTSKMPKKTTTLSELKITKFNKYNYLISIIDNNNFTSQKPLIKSDDGLQIYIKSINNKTKNTKNFTFPFLNRFRKRNPIFNIKNEAVAPPLGDIATGSVLLENRGFIKLNGPNISLTLNNSSAKSALMKLAKLAGYGFVLTNESTNSQNISSAKSEEINNSPYVTLSFFDEDYSVAFNSILFASGLQAKVSDNLIIVGKNILGKTFGPKISKVYRLNQTSASSAADYLATLGASISKVDTISGSSSKGVSANNIKLIDTYSSSSGPLVGLTGTTDSRLQTITLVGNQKIIFLAEKYLKQLDLRQRQVALTVKILDVELTNDDSTNFNSAFRNGSTFIVNEGGKLFTAFGNFIPPALSDGIPGWNSLYSNESTTKDGVTTNEDSTKQTINTNVIPNPGFQYNANEIYKYLIAQIRSSKTKVLSNPTLILSESIDKIDGGAKIIGDTDKAIASIGRPYANESFITLGTKVITNYKAETSEEGGTTTCEATFSTSGLTFGARVHKIDDNGFVTFSLSPELTSISDQIMIPNCGLVNILNVRRLDTGKLRVKDSHTLILTGVISDFDNKITTKTPLLGDIPILGRLFRSTTGSKRNSELVILITPKIIDDSYPEESRKNVDNINPSSKETKELWEEKL